MEALELSYYCDLAWSDLPGDSNARRHCDRCDTAVYNLSGMTQAQAARLLKANDAPACVHFVSRNGKIVHEGDPLEQLASQRYGAKKLLVGALAVQAGFMALAGPERVFLDPFISGMTTVVRVFGNTVEGKHEKYEMMGNMAVDSEVEF